MPWASAAAITPQKTSPQPVVSMAATLSAGKMRPPKRQPSAPSVTIAAPASIDGCAQRLASRRLAMTRLHAPPAFSAPGQNGAGVKIVVAPRWRAAARMAPVTSSDEVALQQHDVAGADAAQRRLGLGEGQRQRAGAGAHDAVLAARQHHQQGEIRRMRQARQDSSSNRSSDRCRSTSSPGGRRCRAARRTAPRAPQRAATTAWFSPLPPGARAALGADQGLARQRQARHGRAADRGPALPITTTRLMPPLPVTARRCRPSWRRAAVSPTNPPFRRRRARSPSIWLSPRAALKRV